MNLHDVVIGSALRTPEALAIKGPEGNMTYGELDRCAQNFALALVQLGVQCGDRVGIWLEKSAYAIAAMQGVLRLGAIYVPLDPLSPIARLLTILRDCDVQVLVTTQGRAEAIRTYAGDLQDIACLCVNEGGLENYSNGHSGKDYDLIQHVQISEDDVAYILYTSGSTGKPKGVCISHRNALAFIRWASAMLQATPDDRLANHAPFHFDLSVLDLYVAFLAGACVILIPDSISYFPIRLVNFILLEKPTIWYSVPSVLIMMIEQGKFLEVEPLSLRCILFAGEPFPIKYFRRLYQHWPDVRFLNLYGPTETNVCTYYEVIGSSDGLTRSLPIGKACSGTIVWAQKEDGTPAGVGGEGELMVAGPTVMVGYWGQPGQGAKPYATGDLVRLQEDGNYVYVGRRDRMMKVRGYRVEAGDVEAALLEHPAIYEAAVIVSGIGIDARLVAFIVTRDASAPSLLEVKKHCSERLPRYMIVDLVHAVSSLPYTRNGKIDRLSLVDLVAI